MVAPWLLIVFAGVRELSGFYVPFQTEAAFQRAAAQIQAAEDDSEALCVPSG